MVSPLNRAIQILERIVSVDTTPQYLTVPLIEMIEDTFKANGAMYVEFAGKARCC